MLYTDLTEEHLRLLEAPFIKGMFDPDLDDEGAAESEEALDPEEALEQLKAGVLFPRLMDRHLWLDFGDGLHIGSQWQPLGSNSTSPTSTAADLQQLGFSCIPPAPAPSLATVLLRLRAALDRLASAGFAPTFLFVYDETWQLMEYAMQQLSPVLGPDLVIEPSFFVYKLIKGDLPPSEAVGKQYIGNSFALPHRDFNFTESNDPDGRPKMLSIWVPVTDATLNNGCMYVLPREFDALFSEPEAYSHLRPAMRRQADASGPASFTVGTVAGCDTVAATELRFDLSGARALPAPAGTVCCWHGNLIHWGTRCARDAPVPRVSLACTLRRRDAARTHLDRDLPGVPIRQLRQLSLGDRLRMIGNTLLVFKYWYSLEHWAPPEYRIPAATGATLVTRESDVDDKAPLLSGASPDPLAVQEADRRAYLLAMLKLTVANMLG